MKIDEWIIEDQDIKTVGTCVPFTFVYSRKSHSPQPENDGLLRTIYESSNNCLTTKMYSLDRYNILQLWIRIIFVKNIVLH